MEDGTALYVEVSRQIKRDIQLGIYQENTPLPKEDALSTHYGVARSTIHRALEILKKEDVIFSVQGNGTYVKPYLFTQQLSSFYSFTDTLKGSNILIQNKIVDCEVVSADKWLSKETGYPAGTKFHRLLRLRSAKAYPLMLETTYLPQARFWKLDIDILSKGSLYEFLRNRYDFHADRATEKFQPVIPRPEERTLLHISSNTPCMLLERYSYEGDVLIEYTKSIVRGDKYAFRIELVKDVAHPL